MLEVIPGFASEKSLLRSCPLPDRATRNWTLDGSSALGVATPSTPAGRLFLNGRMDAPGNRMFRSLMEERDRKEVALTQTVSHGFARRFFLLRWLKLLGHELPSPKS